MQAEIRVPASLGESVIEATVGKWHKREGEPVASGEVVVELETDKVNMDVEADQAGVLEHIARDQGAVVGVGELLGTIAAVAAPDNAAPASGQPGGVPAPAPPAAPVEVTAGPPAPQDTAGERVPATPVARRIATEAQIDLSQVQGSGLGGRITKQDVAAAQARVEPAPPSAPAVAPPAPATTASNGQGLQLALPAAARPDRERRVRMSRRRLTIARRLVEAQRTAAMLTTFNEVDMSAIMEVRKRRRDAFKERHGIGLGYMSFFTKAAVGALKAFPNLNAEIDGEEMVLKAYYDIGIAVGTDEGLVVPVVRDADRKGFAEIEQAIADLAARARANTLSLADLQGGTFTITNGGIYGSLLSTPILNTPQVGILGMHKIEERPVVVGGQVVVRPMMYLALSYDHRMVDGNEAVRFLVRLKELIEDPESLLLEG